MNNITRIIALVAVAVFATSAFAQGQGQGGRGQGRGGGGQGGGFGGGGQRGLMFFSQGGTMLLRRADVQADLGVTPEQKTALEALQQAMREEMGNMYQEISGSGDRDAQTAAMQAAMKKLTDANTKKVDAILKPEQTKRLKEIDIQLAGNRAVIREDVQKDLALTKAQLDQIKALQTKQREANDIVRDRQRNGELDRDQATDARANNDKILGDELGKLLKPEQAAKLKTMAGKPFKADEIK